MYVNTYQIKNTIGVQMANYWNKARNYAGFSDSQYYLLNMGAMQDYLSSFPISGAPLGEGFDCDDYSFVLKGQIAIHNRDQFGFGASLGVGIAWGQFHWANGFHATNWFLEPDGSFHWVEPQTGTIYPINQCLPGTLSLILI